MYQPHVPSLSVRAANVLRLPFEFAACCAAELCALIARGFEVPDTPKARASKVQSSDPLLALCLVLSPFLPAFQQSIAEQAKSGRESLWASYDTQAKDAVQLTKQVSQPARRWLKRCWERVLTADWQTTRQLLTESWRRFASFISALRPGKRKALQSALEDVTRECDDVKEIFKAGKLEEAEKRYQQLLLKLQELSKANFHVQKEQVRILTNLSLCQKKQGSLGPAADSASAALQLEPSNVKALFLRGSCTKGAEAVEDLAKAFALEPTLLEAKREWLQARRVLRKDVDESWSKGEILAVIADVTRVQQSVQEAVSSIGKDVKTRDEKLTFLQAHERIRQHALPKDPLKDYGLTMDSFHQLLGTFQDDFDVIHSAQNMLHPSGRGDRSRARRMSIMQIVQSHQAMVLVIKTMLQELRQMSPVDLHRLDLQLLEATAELLSYLEVSSLDLHPEDVEEAISMNEFQLQNNADFSKCSEELANLMQELMDFTSSLPQRMC